MNVVGIRKMLRDMQHYIVKNKKTGPRKRLCFIRAVLVAVSLGSLAGMPVLAGEEEAAASDEETFLGAEYDWTPMPALDWNYYLENKDFHAKGEADGVFLNEDHTSGTVGVVTYLGKAAEEDFRWAQKLEMEAGISKAYTTILSADREDASTLARYADKEDVDTGYTPAKVGYATGNFHDFQGLGQDSMPELNWSLGYNLSVYLVSEAYMPSDNFLIIGELPRSAEGGVEDAKLVRTEMEEEGYTYESMEIGDRPCMLRVKLEEDTSYTEGEDFTPGDSITVGAVGEIHEMTEEEQIEAFGRVIGTSKNPIGVGDDTSSGDQEKDNTDNGSHTRKILYTITDKRKTCDYFILDELPECPGYYALIHVNTYDDFYAVRGGATTTFGEAQSALSEYNELSSAIYEGIGELADVELAFGWYGQGDFAGMEFFDDSDNEDDWIEEEEVEDADKNPGSDKGSLVKDEVVEGKKEKDEDDEDKDGSSIPGMIAVGVAGAIIAAGAGGAAGLGASGAGGEMAKNTAADEEKLKTSRYRMYIYKEFGNGIDPGAAPRKVYAYMKEALPGGEEIRRDDLTSQIVVSSGDGHLTVKDGGLEEKGKVAIVSAPEDSGYSQGMVSFRFIGAGGAFTKHVVFDIVNPEILLVQDSIAFIATNKKTASFGFTVRGLGAEPVFEINSAEGTDKVFKLSEVKKKEDGVWFIDITEISDEKHYAGYFEEYNVEITARAASDKGAQAAGDGAGTVASAGNAAASAVSVASGAVVAATKKPKMAVENFRIVRFEEGIRIKVNDLKAYLVEAGTEDVTGHENAKIKQGMRATPAHSRAEVTLYTWDEEEGCLTNPVPEKAEVFAEDVPATPEEVETIARGITNVCEMLQFVSSPVSVTGNNNTVLLEVFQTGQSMFMPPGRAKAKVTVRVSWKKRVFEESCQVSVITQPRRVTKDMAEFAAMQKEDERLLENLFRMKRRIYSMDTAYEMRPLIHRIELAIDGYDPEFGLYMPEYEQCKALFARFINGDIGSRAKTDVISTWDYFWGEGAERTLQEWEKSELTMMQRMGLGLITLGASEIYLTSKEGVVEWLRGVKNYADNSDYSDNLLKNFTVGAVNGGWIILREYASGKLGDAVMQPTMKFGGMVIKENAKLMAGSLKKNASKVVKWYSRVTYGTRLEKTGKLLKKMEEKALKTATERMDDAAEMIQKNEKLLARDKKYQAYREEGKKLVEDYARSLKDPNITEEAQTLLLEKIQCHKGAMYHLNSKEIPNSVRARFNLDQHILKERTLNEVQKELGKKFNTSPSNFKTFKATSNSMAGQRKGLSSSMDHDFTFTDIRTGDDVASDITKKIYAEKYYKRVHGKNAPSQKIAEEFMEQADQTAVAKWDRESYADDIDQLMNPDLANKPYKDIDRAMDTTIYKTDEWVDKGLATGGGDGLGKIHEGGRQTMKSNKRMVLQKVKAVLLEGKLTEKDLPMKEIQELMDTNSMIKQSFDYKAGKMGRFVELETALAKGGSSLKDEIRKTAAVMQKIQDLQLNYRSPSEKLTHQLEKMSKQVDELTAQLQKTYDQLPSDTRKKMEQAMKDLKTLQGASVVGVVREKDPAEEIFYANEDLEGDKLSEWLSTENRLSMPKVEVVYAKGRSSILPPREKIERVLANDAIIEETLGGKDGTDMGDMIELMGALAEGGMTMNQAMEESNEVRAAIDRALDGDRRMDME